MIEVLHGDLFSSNCEALVNTVNCVGTWGKGVALEFKKRFPECFKAHKIACDAGQVQPGKMYVCEHLFEPRYVISFPTKVHWKNPSKIEWIEDGLDDLVRVIKEGEIDSIAIPALGCGNGGLDFFGEVLPLMLEKLSPLENIRIEIYAPR